MNRMTSTTGEPRSDIGERKTNLVPLAFNSHARKFPWFAMDLDRAVVT